MSAARPRRPHHAATGLLDAAAHALRSSLNGIGSWTAVLESRLGDSPDPMVARALAGIRLAIGQQVSVIENLLEAGVVEPPLRRPSMTKRNDAQPGIPDDSKQMERPKRPAPDAMKPEQPGGRDAAKAEDHAKDKTTRRGER